MHIFIGSISNKRSGAWWGNKEKEMHTEEVAIASACNATGIDYGK